MQVAGWSCAYQAYICTVTAHAKKPVLTNGLLDLFDAWQLMAGVLPATLRAVAAQRSNPLPADFTSSG
ncbi:hypothetical protein A8275_25970, partial [Salmonella enterica subsp. enterica serovar Typhimurium]